MWNRNRYLNEGELDLAVIAEELEREVRYRKNEKARVGVLERKQTMKISEMPTLTGYIDEVLRFLKEKGIRSSIYPENFEKLREILHN